jgi:hypothetical protein
MKPPAISHQDKHPAINAVGIQVSNPALHPVGSSFV